MYLFIACISRSTLEINFGLEEIIESFLPLLTGLTFSQIFIVLQLKIFASTIRVLMLLQLHPSNLALFTGLVIPEEFSEASDNLSQYLMMGFKCLC